MTGDFSALMSAAASSSVQRDDTCSQKVRRFEAFESMYLSVHILDLRKGIEDAQCSCPCFNTHSVCWMKAYAQLRGHGGINAGVKLGSFPAPAEAARVYLGITKPNKRVQARPQMIDTPKRTRLHRKTTPSEFKLDDSHTPLQEDRGGEPKSASGTSILPSPPASWVSEAASPVTIEAARHVTFHVPGDFFETFTDACNATRKRGVEHMAFVFGFKDLKESTEEHPHYVVTHLAFPPQTVRPQTVEADLTYIMSMVDREKLRCDNTNWEHLEVIGWIHDHHVLPSEPTIDFDLWAQYWLSRDNPCFAMIITGCRCGVDTLAERTDAWYDQRNWHYWFSLTPQAIGCMDVARSMGDVGAQREKLRDLMGPLCPLSNYVVHAQDSGHIKLHTVRTAGRVAVARASDCYLTYG